MKSALEDRVDKIIKTILIYTSDRDSFGRSQNVVDTVMPVIKAIYEKYFRVDLIGKNYLKRKGPFIMVSNHSGMLPYDAAMIAHALDSQSKCDLRFLADKFAYKLPVVGSIIRLLGAVPASYDNALNILDSGHPLLIFPEGVAGIGKEYSRRYRLNRFSSGFARLAREMNVPIVPIGVVGAEEIHPVVYREEKMSKTIGLPFLPITPTFPWLGPLGLLPLPSKWVISVGKPIKPDEPVRTLVSKARKSVRELISKGRKKRKNIWE